MGTLKDIYSCDLHHAWLWEHGHIDRSKFKGKCLSNVNNFDADFEIEDIINAKVRYGWVFSIAGDTDGCGWDTTTIFVTEEPNIEDYTVVDGPHLATWLEVA
jgi:hypothetical protein